MQIFHKRRFYPSKLTERMDRRTDAYQVINAKFVHQSRKCHKYALGTLNTQPAIDPLHTRYNFLTIPHYMALEGAFKCDNTHIFQEFKDIAPFFQIFHQKICQYPSNMTKRFSPMWSYDNPTRHRQPLLNVTIHKTSRRSDTMRRVYSNMPSVTTLTSLK